MTNYRRRKRIKREDPAKKFKTNKRISADTIRVIDDEGGMLGVMSLKEALAMASEKELDLVEINPKAEPPIVKLIDYNKFKYQISKSGATKQKKKEEKTFRVSVRVSLNDMQVRARQIDQLLEKDVKIKLQVQMRGREKVYPNIAKETIDAFLKMITAEYIFESEPKLTGDSYYSTIKTKKTT